METTTPYKARAMRARAVQTGDTVKADEASRVLAEHRLRKAIEKAVEAATPLTDAQRARLAVLLLAPNDEAA